MQPGKRIKVVLDTNTIISGLLGRDGNPARVLEKLGSGDIINHTSKDILCEVERVLSRPKILNQTTEYERHCLLHFMELTSALVHPLERLNVVKEDPADNRVLECALEGNADYIVTGDQHLLKLREYMGIKIVKSKEFLDILG